MKKASYIAMIIGAVAWLKADVTVAALAKLPVIPKPTIPLSKVLELGQKKFPMDEAYVLVSIDWAKVSTFKPRVSDGTQYHPEKKDAETYSWFLTYVYNRKVSDNGSGSTVDKN